MTIQTQRMTVDEFECFAALPGNVRRTARYG